MATAVYQSRNPVIDNQGRFANYYSPSEGETRTVANHVAESNRLPCFLVAKSGRFPCFFQGTKLSHKGVCRHDTVPPSNSKASTKLHCDDWQPDFHWLAEEHHEPIRISQMRNPSHCRNLPYYPVCFRGANLRGRM